MKIITQKMLSILSIALTITLFGSSTLFGAAAPSYQGGGYREPQRGRRQQGFGGRQQGQQRRRGQQGFRAPRQRLSPEEQFRRMEPRARYTALDSQLFAAINAGNYNAVFQALQDGAGPNATSRITNFSALATAAAKGQIDIVNILLLYGAQDIATAQAQVDAKREQLTVNIQALEQQPELLKQQRTAELETATNQQLWGALGGIKARFNTQIAQLQAYIARLHAQLDNLNNIAVELAAAIDPNQITRSNKLIRAVVNENINEVQTALGNGVNIHARNANGDTPLIIAASLGNGEIVQLLLEHIQNQTEAIVALTVANAEGNTALEEAIRVSGESTTFKGIGATGAKYHTGKPEIVELLANFARENDAVRALNRRNPQWHLRTALHSVVRRVEGSATTAKAGFMDPLSAIRMVAALTANNAAIISIKNEYNQTAQQALKRFSKGHLEQKYYEAMHLLLSANPVDRQQGQEAQTALALGAFARFTKAKTKPKKRQPSPTTSEGTSESDEEDNLEREVKNQITRLEEEIAKFNQDIAGLTDKLTKERETLKANMEKRTQNKLNPRSGRIYNEKTKRIESLEGSIEHEKNKRSNKQADLETKQAKLAEIIQAKFKQAEFVEIEPAQQAKLMRAPHVEFQRAELIEAKQPIRALQQAEFIEARQIEPQQAQLIWAPRRAKLIENMPAVVE